MFENVSTLKSNIENEIFCLLKNDICDTICKFAFKMFKKLVDDWTKKVAYEFQKCSSMSIVAIIWDWISSFHFELFADFEETWKKIIESWNFTIDCCNDWMIEKWIDVVYAFENIVVCVNNVVETLNENVQRTKIVLKTLCIFFWCFFKLSRLQNFALQMFSIFECVNSHLNALIRNWDITTINKKISNENVMFEELWCIRKRKSKIMLLIKKCLQNERRFNTLMKNDFELQWHMFLSSRYC